MIKKQTMYDIDITDCRTYVETYEVKNMLSLTEDQAVELRDELTKLLVDTNR